MTDIRQLTDEEVAAFGREALERGDSALASLVNEVMYQRSRSKGGVLEVSSIVSMRTGRGMVQFELGSTRIQLEVAEARAHALIIVEAAMAAETDALLVRFLKERIGLAPGAAQAALSDFRTMRTVEVKP
jgi:hypothetical protein